MQDFTGALPGSSSSSESEDEAEKQRRKEEKQARKQVGVSDTCAGRPAVQDPRSEFTRILFHAVCPNAGRHGACCSLDHPMMCGLLIAIACAPSVTPVRFSP